MEIQKMAQNLVQGTSFTPRIPRDANDGNEDLRYE